MSRLAEQLAALPQDVKDRLNHYGFDPARLLKLGKRLAVGEVMLFSGASPDPIAHATLSYSIPNTQRFIR